MLSFLQKALTIRKVEEKLLELHSQRKITCTVHTCIGQELAAVAICEALNEDDSVFSNHRCHGHYLAFTGDIEGLIAEVMGKKNGTCSGIGGSMNLYSPNFLSNGIIGGMAGIAAGVGLSYKLHNSGSIVACFIGDGAMGQGMIYETMNIASLMQIPLLLVCENNAYSYDTPHQNNCAGDIIKRAQAFSIQTFTSDIWHIENLMQTANESVEYIRKTGKPAFHLINSYRLLSHSTHCNDYRNQEEIAAYASCDPLNVFSETDPETFVQMELEICTKINATVDALSQQDELRIAEYYTEPSKPHYSVWTPLETIDTRQVKLINEFFHEAMATDERILFMGEDVLSPFGGAFKIANGLSEIFPDRVFSTPISEQAMTGIAVGLAMMGFRPFLEIMFGDFLTLCMDQLLNHAAKMYLMYNKHLTCPLVIRTPVGAGGGMGATHSQSTEKFMAGIDGIKTIALNDLINPKDIYNAILSTERHPVVVLENKRDYGKKIAANLMKRFVFEKSNDQYPVVRIRPNNLSPNATIVTYGGMVDTVLASVNPLFAEFETMPEIFVLSCLHPIRYDDIIESVRITKKLFVVEEGTAFAGIGSEIISSVRESLEINFTARRISTLPVPLPAVKSLEHDVVPGVSMILNRIKESINESIAKN
ncbi:MAG: thiamine pyrophosphate-dependent enzyme [Candidatus Auribacterota bacterium]